MSRWLKQIVHAGLDIGKESIFCTLRWSVDDFDRPWRARNPSDVGRLAELLREVGRGRRLVVAMEPTGTYGDALRQALERQGVAVHRVSPKNASDYAEVFDGVPSQHDGKDAAVVAEFAAQGRCWPWPLPRHRPKRIRKCRITCSGWTGQRRQMMVWCGRVEALLSRHWPEATSVVLVRCCRGLCCVAWRSTAVRVVWRRRRMVWPECGAGAAIVCRARKAAGVGDQCPANGGRGGGSLGGRTTASLRPGDSRLSPGEMQASRRRLRELTRGHAGIAALGSVVGVPTACVLWTELGDPRLYSCGAAYRKAMGLNLAERSSGKWQGKLKISKRGSSKVRRWLYLAALRWLKHEPVRSWYLRQKAQRRGEGKAAVIGVMRKLALALYCVGGRGEKFDA